MIKSIALGAVLSLAAVAAQAAPVVATLQSPLAKADTVLAGDIAWDCQGATCTSGEVHNDTFSIETCRALGKQVGAVSSFISARGSLDDAKLAKCNAGLGGGAGQTVKSSTTAAR